MPCFGETPVFCLQAQLALSRLNETTCGGFVAEDVKDQDLITPRVAMGFPTTSHRTDVPYAHWVGDLGMQMADKGPFPQKMDWKEGMESQMVCVGFEGMESNQAPLPRISEPKGSKNPETLVSEPEA